VDADDAGGAPSATGQRDVDAPRRLPTRIQPHRGVEAHHGTGRGEALGQKEAQGREPDGEGARGAGGCVDVEQDRPHLAGGDETADLAGLPCGPVRPEGRQRPAPVG